MKLPRTRNRWTERLLIDDAFDAYLEWRDESAEVWHACKRWNGAPAREARRKLWAHRTALERGEHAARVYARLAQRTSPGSPRSDGGPGGRIHERRLGARSTAQRSASHQRQPGSLKATRSPAGEPGAGNPRFDLLRFITDAREKPRR